MRGYAMIPVLAFVLDLFVWTFVYGQRRRDPVNRAFLLFTAFASLWVLCEIHFAFPASFGNEMLVLRLISLFWIPLGFLFLNFAYRLTGKAPDAAYWTSLVVSIAGVIVDLSTDLILRGYQRYEWGVADVRGPWHTAVSLVPTASSVYGLYLVWRASRTAEPGLHNSLVLVLWGGGLALGASMTSNVIIPNILGVVDLFRFGSSAIAVFCVFIYAAVRRHNFLTVTVEHAAESLFSNVREGIVLADGQGRVLRMNAAAREIFEAPGEPRGEERLADLVGVANAGREFVGLEMTLVQGGAERVVSMTQSSNIRSGVDIGKILLVRDVTRQKEAERILRRSKEELEKEVERRTEELRHAQRMEAIGMLAGGIAHDFNNLLAAILGFAGAAREDLPEGSPLKADLDEVVRAARRARDIVQQILAFSRGSEREKRPVRMREIVRESLKLLRVSLPAGIEIRERLDEEAVVLADGAQIQQIVMNLCTNSFHAMRDRGGILEVGLDCVERGDVPGLAPGPGAERWVRLVVADTGPGIPPGDLGRIFDPFFTTKPEGQGTGLGLSTVREIARGHGGIVGVSSEVGRGTRFEVHLPCHAGDGLPAEGEPEAVRGHGERILVVDDEDQVLRALGRMLEPLGYGTTLCADGGEALAAFSAQPGAFDLVIVDQTMPGMSGLDVTARITAIRPELPVLMISGFDRGTTLESARASGVRAFLAKPLEKRLLAEEVRGLLDRKPHER
jgi:signal transduction histidine kinase/ActR/RegA family two-component response regulator